MRFPQFAVAAFCVTTGVIGAVSRPVAATVPDLSGTWTYNAAATEVSIKSVGGETLATASPIFGDSFVVTQNDKTLTMNISAGIIKATAIYKLDGTDSKNSSPSGIPGGAPIEVTSVAKWDGQRLLITSSSQSPGSGRGAVNGMITVRSTRQIFLDDKGQLVIDRTGTPRTVVPNTRSVYVKKN